MISGNILIAFSFTQYCTFFMSMLNKKNRAKLASSNERLEKLRKIPYKTLDEQKEFVRLKYKQEKKEFNWIVAAYMTVINIVLFMGSLILLNMTTFRPNFWLTMLAIILFAYMVNFILQRFNLQRQDTLDAFFR